jgi:Lar family restriction alleviation protein
MKRLNIDDLVISPADLANAGYKTGELLPCPFCGNENILSSGFINSDSKNLVYKVFCNDTFTCGAEVFVCLGKRETEEAARKEAVNKWNRRV